MSHLLPMAVIVPSRGRPANARRLAEAHRETSDLPHGHNRLWFEVDDDDPHRADYQALPQWPAAPTHVRVLPRLGMCGSLNRAAVDLARNHAVIGFLGDDHVPRTPGWDRTVLAELDEMGTGIVYGNDLFQGANLPSAVFMTADIVRTLGYMAPSTLRHMYPDNFWRDLGLALGALRYLPDVIIEHMHPQAGKGTEDAGYHEVWPLMERDRLAYEEYKASGAFDADVERIRVAGSLVR